MNIACICIVPVAMIFSPFSGQGVQCWRRRNEAMAGSGWHRFGYKGGSSFVGPSIRRSVFDPWDFFLRPSVGWSYQSISDHWNAGGKAWEKLWEQRFWLIMKKALGIGQSIEISSNWGFQFSFAIGWGRWTAVNGERLQESGRNYLICILDFWYCKTVQESPSLKLQL